MKLRNFVPTATMLLLCAFTAFAQTGTIEGDVRGPDGDPLVGATVKIDRTDLPQHFQVRSDRKGHFFYEGLGIGGKYNLSVVWNGQDLQVAEGIALPGGDPVQIPVDLSKIAAPGVRRSLTGRTMNEQNGGPLSPEQRAAIEQERQRSQELLAKKQALIEAFKAGMRALETKQYDLSVASFTKATEIDSSYGIVWAQLAQAFLGLAGAKVGTEREQAMAQGLVAYQKAVGLNPEDAAFHNNYALALGRAGKFDDARAELLKAIDLDGTNAGKYQFILGVVLTLAGRSDEAASAFKNAAEAGNAEAYYQYGLVLFTKARADANGQISPTPGTIEALQKYVQLAPGGSNFRKACSILATLNRLDAACQNPGGQPIMQAGVAAGVPRAQIEQVSPGNPPAPATTGHDTPAGAPSGCPVNIRGGIDQVLLRGEYAPLPLIQPIGSSPSANGMALIEIQNGTAYAMTALFSGPIDRCVDVNPGRSVSVELEPGSYKIVDRVNAVDVDPSYGEHTFDARAFGIELYIN